MKLINYILSPIALIYGGITYLRNILYNKGILPSKSYSTPIICIGNLSLGGTGKTPHTEMLLQMLSNYNITVLSRGYKRKTKGTVLISTSHSALDVGDEPFQMHSKFPLTKFVVDEDRQRGINFILKNFPKTQVIVLDDALQHRKINAGLNLLLTEYSNPYFNDYPIPMGKLRDSKLRAKDANIIIVTKCPEDISEDDKIRFTSGLQLSSKQQVFFSSIVYNEPTALFSDESQFKECKNLMLLTGLANPGPLENHLKKKHQIIKHYKFPDHHFFNLSDIKSINENIGSFAGNSVCIVTTEKDAARLKSYKDDKLFDAPVFYIAITVKIIDEENNFQKIIEEYVKQD